jgi:hypothetical protein
MGILAVQVENISLYIQNLPKKNIINLPKLYIQLKAKPGRERLCCLLLPSIVIFPVTHFM